MSMKRRSFFAFLATVPFMPKALFGGDKQPQFTYDGDELRTFRTSGTSRWVLTPSGVVETGAGSNFEVSRFSAPLAVDGKRLPVKHVETVGDGVSRELVVTHNLGTTDVICSVHLGEMECLGIVRRTSPDSVTITFVDPPPKDSVRVVVIG